MDRIRRNERLAAMTRILVAAPNHIFTLSYFCEMFGAAKSTLSEDIDILRDVLAQFHLGQLETVTGAAAASAIARSSWAGDALACVQSVAEMLSSPGRVLPGGFVYMADVLSMPDLVEKMGMIMASQFYKQEPDFVLTMETKGIPVALMAAKALDVPLVIVRRDSKVYEGAGGTRQIVDVHRRPGGDDVPFTQGSQGRAAGGHRRRLHARGRHGARHGRHDA